MAQRRKSVCVGKKMRSCKRTRRYCKFASGTKRKFCRRRHNRSKKA